MEFVSSFGSVMKPNFVGEGFLDALQRSRGEFKLLFVYLHSPDHPDTQSFCEGTLCNEVLAAFVNQNFVSWGGSIRASEGFKMSKSLKASPSALWSCLPRIRGSHCFNRYPCFYFVLVLFLLHNKWEFVEIVREIGVFSANLSTFQT
ncbi:hypothetical protein Ddye_002942 [Dipteronia dyeriana]|uniref:UAS domain-containing protein n=1 Tax=Dipteronia dyeriana TaxID=168575 RepID=A0AAD9XS11_9ROSI|nr:hypothetical protein Ddye_002942 [Dipteronia dyeriana]